MCLCKVRSFVSGPMFAVIAQVTYFGVRSSVLHPKLRRELRFIFAF
jgi:hypothetical protein